MSEILKKNYEAFLACNNVINTDTRKAVKDAFFICLKGDNFNANEMAEVAMKNGAKYVLTNRKDLQLVKGYLYAEDTLVAFQQLANCHRLQMSIPVIAIGGSNGKTTTKELMSEVFKLHYITHVTPGNFNNHIGVPITLLQLNKSHQIALVELGINHPQEMTDLCKIAAPTEGLLTNIGKEHLAGFGSIEGVAKAESELFDYLLKNNGLCYVNTDDQWLNNMAKRLPKKVFFGEGLNQITLERLNPSIVFKYKNHGFKSHLSGGYNLSNILATIAVAEQHQIPLNTIAEGIKNYLPTNNRSQWLATDNNKILMDCYNANPSSMELTIANFLETTKEKKLYLIGDMLELGSFEAVEHQNIVDMALGIRDPNNEFIFIGEAFLNTNAPTEFKVFSNVETLNEKYLSQKKYTNHFVLLKASRGIKLEKALLLL